MSTQLRRDRRLVGLPRMLELSGLSQTQLAERSGLSPQYISDILNGRRKGYAERGELASALGCTITDLMPVESDEVPA